MYISKLSAFPYGICHVSITAILCLLLYGASLMGGSGWMIDFSPEAEHRDRRGEFPEGGRHLGRLGTKAPAAGAHRGRTFPATYTSTPNSTLSIIVLHKQLNSIHQTCTRTVTCTWEVPPQHQLLQITTLQHPPVLCGTSPLPPTPPDIQKVT